MYFIKPKAKHGNPNEEEAQEEDEVAALQKELSELKNERDTLRQKLETREVSPTSGCILFLLGQQGRWQPQRNRALAGKPARNGGRASRLAERT